MKTQRTECIITRSTVEINNTICPRKATGANKQTNSLISLGLFENHASTLSVIVNAAKKHKFVLK